MTRRLRIVIVQGGPSIEAEVSRASAREVAGALTVAGHDAVRMELNAYLAESIREGGYDLVFPVVHGAVGEDGALQGLLEVLDVPYVGSAVLASALAMDKRAARGVFAAAGLPIASGVAAARGEDALVAASRAREAVGRAVVVKPASAGSGIGVARLEASATDDEVAAAITAVWAIDSAALVERFVRGREVTCGVLDVDSAPRALPPTEIFSPVDAFYTFEARYAPGRSRHVCPAALPAHVLARVQEVALDAHRALGCRDLSRADFVVGDTNEPDAVCLLEVNTIPGFTATSLYPEAAAVAGLPFPELCDTLARAALARGATPRNAPRAFPRS